MRRKVSGSLAVTPKSMPSNGPRQHPRCRCADHMPTAASPRVCADNSGLKPGRRSAQRHADADLLRSLVHPIGNDAVNSERRQHQREEREAAEQQHHKAPRRDRLVHESAARCGSSFPGRFGAIGLSAARTPAASSAGGRELRTTRSDGRHVAALPHRQIHLIARRLLEREVPHVADHAHHTPFAAGAHQLPDAHSAPARVCAPWSR